MPSFFNMCHNNATYKEIKYLSMLNLIDFVKTES